MRIDKAGAHLQAYIDTLPTIIALRLCSRFGSGPQCCINKLPVELVSIIEKFIVEPAREETFVTWSRNYRCFELRCDIIDDHMTHDQQHELYHLDENRPCSETTQCTFNQEPNMETAAINRKKMLNCVFDSTGFWDAEHDIRVGAWESKVGMDDSHCIFTQHEVLLRSHFGIDFWTSIVRLPPLEVVRRKSEEWKLTEGHNTSSMAYMTLPNDGHTREKWATRLHGDDFETGYASSVHLGATPSQASLRRFSRALNILGLEVFIHPQQRRTVISSRTDLESSDLGKSAEEPLIRWPQLTLLTRCCAAEV